MSQQTQPKLTIDEFISEFRKQRASAILRTDKTDAARNAMNAAVAGGFRIVEFTLSIPGALDLISEFAGIDSLIVGAGTVLTTDEAVHAVQAGAQFLVAPNVDEHVIGQASELGVAMMPGCATPSEMLLAHRAGARLQKLFPEQGCGPAWVKQTLGPMPFLNIVPTAGVTLENASQYFAAGSHAVGFVNSLFDPALIASSDWAGIESLASQMLKAVCDA